MTKELPKTSDMQVNLRGSVDMIARTFWLIGITPKPMILCHTDLGGSVNEDLDLVAPGITHDPLRSSAGLTEVITR